MTQRAYVECYLEHNLGDDLFLMRLGERYPHVEMTVIADASYDSLLARIPNVRRIDSDRTPNDSENVSLISRLSTKRSTLRNKATVALESDCVISVGGSIFIEPDRGNRLATFCHRHAKMLEDRTVLATGKDTFVLGANFGPYKTRSFLSFYQKLFESNCRDVCFRDAASFGLFSRLGNTRMAPDLLFSTKIPQLAHNGTAFISVVHLGNHGVFGDLSAFGEPYLSAILNLALACNKRGLTPILSSFSLSQHDALCCDSLCQRLSRRGVAYGRIDYTGDPAPILEGIASSSVIIGTRFHSIVLGMVAGKPVLPVIYSNKTTNMLEDAGFSLGSTIDLRRPDTLPLAKKDAERLLQRVLEDGPFDVAWLAHESLRHFSALDEYLTI